MIRQGPSPFLPSASPGHSTWSTLALGMEPSFATPPQNGFADRSAFPDSGIAPLPPPPAPPTASPPTAPIAVHPDELAEESKDGKPDPSSSSSSSQPIVHPLEEWKIPEGHLGNLTSEQEKLLQEFRRQLPQGLKHSELSPGNDSELMRFLRARKFDVEKALAQYLQMKAWRAEHGVDEILQTPLLHSQLVESIIPSKLHGVARNGTLLYVEKTGKINPQALLSLLTEEECKRAHIYRQEVQLQRLRELSLEFGRNIDSVSTILDLTGLNITHRKVVHFIKMIAEIDQGYYPETLSNIYVINAPWVFPALWSICKKWIDPRTREKIKVITQDPYTALQEYIHPSQIPREYGGTCVSCPGTAGSLCIPEHSTEQLELMGGGFSTDLDFQKELIPSGKKYEFQIDIAGQGCVLGWFFKLTGKDVDFSVSFVQEGVSSQEEIPVVAATRLRNCDRSFEGSWTAPGKGTCVLVWDNSYSWVRSKTIQFVVTVTDAGTVECAEKALNYETPPPDTSRSYSTEASEESKISEECSEE